MSATLAELWNARLLGLFGPILILTGVTGFLIPPRLAVMSGAAPYNVFHIVAGAVGTTLVLLHCATSVAVSNLVFGLIDLYQAVAGLTGIFPTRIFRYKLGDHVAHVLFGLLLAAVGWMGLRG